MKINKLYKPIIYAVLGLLSTATGQIIFPNLINKTYFGLISYIMPILLILLISQKNKYNIYLKKYNNFVKSIKYITPIITIVLLNIAVSISSIKNNILKPNYLEILLINILLSTAIAFFEEMLFRNIIFHKLLENYSFNTSVITSSIMFGLFHLGNISTSNLENVILQIIYTTILGIFFISIYVKTNNIYIPMLAHMIIDFFAMTNEIFIYQAQNTNINIISAIITILITLPCLTEGIIIIKNFKKLNTFKK